MNAFSTIKEEDHQSQIQLKCIMDCMTFEDYSFNTSGAIAFLQMNINELVSTEQAVNILRMNLYPLIGEVEEIILNSVKISMDETTIPENENQRQRTKYRFAGFIVFPNYKTYLICLIAVPSGVCVFISFLTFPFCHKHSKFLKIRNNTVEPTHDSSSDEEDPRIEDDPDEPLPMTPPSSSRRGSSSRRTSGIDDTSDDGYSDGPYLLTLNAIDTS
jgi:hypothetical protein